MSAKLNKVEVQVVPDESSDASYLEQEGLGFEDRLEAYQRGDFGFVGVRLSAELLIPDGKGFIIQTITTPGLWGIEDDSGDEYILEVARDELETLTSMLSELGVESKDAAAMLEP